MNRIVQDAPSWLLKTLPAFATVDESLEAEVQTTCASLPESIGALATILNRRMQDRAYDSAVNLANAHVWQAMDALLDRPDLATLICRYLENHFTHHGLSRVIRRMLVHPYFRDHGLRLCKDTGHYEASLAGNRYGAGSSATWNGKLGGRRYAGSSKRREEQGVPEIANVGTLREVLGIRSARQLGFLLSAVAENGGPYTTFEIGKRDGGKRLICAPCDTLMWVQRRLHRRILSKVAPDEAAHGFIKDRSTATNAAPHVGAKLVLKFDLRDFFPTIHQHRILGLFASMGYHVGRARYSTDDRSRDVAPVLARLCVVTTHRGKHGVLPQGAPTSPAISNLICRRLDQRLTGLATKFGGAYTRYADDLTFSFHDEILVGRFRWWVDQICFREGFTVRQDKFRAIRDSQRQQVTGIVVNERMNVTRADRRRFRAMLHQCELNSVAEQAKKHPGLRGYLRGFAAYVNMVDPTDEGQLMRKVRELLGGDEQ